MILEIEDSAAEFEAIRRDLHAHPELSFTEERTASRVAALLEGWGIPVVRGVGRTGVVGVLKRGHGKRAIGLRADMDALPLEEHNRFAHASRHPGRMHACGHDGHTAIGMGVAQLLVRHRNRLPGRVKLVFQPAEEGGGGAREMIKDGLFKQFPCDAVFGLHNWPGLAEGHFGVTPGPMMASSNEFTITIRGKGGHAALPHNSADPVLAGAHVVTALQSIITRNKRPVDAAVLSVTQFHAGETSNVIPDSAMIGGTVRTFTNEVLDLIERRLNEVAQHVAEGFDCQADIVFTRNYPPTINHDQETQFAIGVMQDLVGTDNVNVRIDPTMGAEDFAFMLQEKPGCYVFLGNGDGDHRSTGHGMGPCHLHNPSYDFNDALIPVGVNYWVALAQKFLAKS
jgi:hippurate hydrolase